MSHGHLVEELSTSPREPSDDTLCPMQAQEAVVVVVILKSRSTTLCPWQRSASWVVNTKARGDTTAALAGIHPSPGGSPLTQVQKLQRMASSGRALL